MKILLDENLPHELRLLLVPAHEVFTVAYLDWAALQNGDLLAQAAAAGFDAMVTKDQGIEFEQNLASLRWPSSCYVPRRTGLRTFVRWSRQYSLRLIRYDRVPWSNSAKASRTWATQETLVHPPIL
jgi:hypothetical protein